MSIYWVLQEQVGWYEASLPLQERRNRGHFSTPPLLIEHILDACGYTPACDLRSIRVLDPACGSGNFLAASANRLLSSAIHANLPQQELIPLVQSNIWGFDPDPISCFLAEMHISSTVISTMSTISQPSLPHPSTWHIHQADGLAFPWEEPCIDLFLANPPYLAAKNTDLSAYRSTHQRGQTDSYLLFLSLGLQIVRPGGWLGLVLPDPLLARTNAANERARLLKEFTIHHLWHLAGVFTAQVGAVVIIAQKTPPQSHHQVAWKRERWQSAIQKPVGAGEEEGKGGDACIVHRPDPRSTSRAAQAPPPLFPSSPAPTGNRLPTHTIAQAVFLRQPRSELRYLLSTGHHSIIERLQNYLHKTPASSSRLATLDNYLSICRGEELGHKSPHLVHHETPSPHGQPLLVHGRGEPLWSPTDPKAPSGSRGPNEPLWSPTDPKAPSGSRGPSEPLWSPTDPKAPSNSLDTNASWNPNAPTDSSGTNAPWSSNAPTDPLGANASWNHSPLSGSSGTIDPSNSPTNPTQQNWYPVLRGGKDIRPYVDPRGNWSIARAAITKPLERYLSPKLLVVKSTDRLQATLDLGGHVALQTLYLLHSRQQSEDELYFFLALLNSNLLRNYVYILHTAYKWVQPQIEQHVLAQLPVPVATTNEKKDIIARSKLLAHACSAQGPVVEWKSDVQDMFEELERAISALYDNSIC